MLDPAEIFLLKCLAGGGQTIHDYISGDSKHFLPPGGPPKNLGPNNTLGDQVRLGHSHLSKMDLIQNQLILSHKKLKPIIFSVC